MKKEKFRDIPSKNYILLGIVFIVSFLFIYYLYVWFDTYKEAKLNMPILNRYMEVINYNELDDYLIENPDSIIYVSVLENSEIREFEKQFKNIFKRNEIEKNILYMDITNDMNNVDNSKYNINGVSILDVPSIMVIDNGMLKSIYSISNNGYNVDMVREYINNINFSSEDELND